MRKRKSTHPAPRKTTAAVKGYEGVLSGVVKLLDTARRTSARSVNSIMTATYWEVGRRIVEFEQGGEKRAGYGEKLIEQLSSDLTRRFGRGFGQRNIECMRQFFIACTSPLDQGKSAEFRIPQTLSAESISRDPNPQTPSAEFDPLIRSTAPSIFQTPSGKSSLIALG